MLACAFTPALIGVDGHLVSIECDITNGLPGMAIVGLGDKAIDEARERVRSAIKNSGLLLPPKRLTLNLAPADMPKDGSSYDLGMAIAILAASGQIDPTSLENSAFLGELALDGSIRPVKGAALAAQLTAHSSLRRIFVPTANAAEANLTGDVKVFAVDSLLQLHRHLTGYELLSVADNTTDIVTLPDIATDMAHIHGQLQAKRAIEIAAAGGHNIILSGPPGTGKTLLAKAITGLLPAPTLDEVIEITVLHSLAGEMSGVIKHRPFRAPHHTASSVALIGGGSKPRPGEISLSHGGVLFLDEMPEFPRSVLEVLRQPLEDGTITVARAAGVTTFPARFMLVGTLNPCPCGYFGTGKKCRCSPRMVATYQRKLSGPLLDRIDMLVHATPTDQVELMSPPPAETSATIAMRVQGARALQELRLRDSPARCNAHMTNEDMHKHCRLNNGLRHLAAQAGTSLGLSARGLSRVIKVARTIADLVGEPDIEELHFAEAIQYRPRLAIEP